MVSVVAVAAVLVLRLAAIGFSEPHLGDNNAYTWSLAASYVSTWAAAVATILIGLALRTSGLLHRTGLIVAALGALFLALDVATRAVRPGCSRSCGWLSGSACSADVHTPRPDGPGVAGTRASCASHGERPAIRHPSAPRGHLHRRSGGRAEGVRSGRELPLPILNWSRPAHRERNVAVNKIGNSDPRTAKCPGRAACDTRPRLGRWADWPTPEPEQPELDDLEGALTAIAVTAVRRALDRRWSR
jgi:hypothetical protein